MFAAAVKNNTIPKTPCVDIKLPAKRPASTLQVLQPSQVRDLIEAVPDRYRAVIIAAVGLGLRPGELFGLTVDRIEFLHRQVRVDQQLVRVGDEETADGQEAPGKKVCGKGMSIGGVVLSPKLKTRTSYRSVPLVEPVAQAISAHMKRYAPHAELNLVFTNEWGVPSSSTPSGRCSRTPGSGPASRPGSMAKRSRFPPPTI